jgi:uncharacterized repeat protein (TIGR01451 family)
MVGRIRPKVGFRQSLAIVLLLAGLVSPALAQVTAGYSEYYIPGDELSMWTILSDLDTSATTTMHTLISVTAWADNTTIYYDHWENGLTFDPANPGGPNTDETYTIAATGGVRTFESVAIPTAPRGTGTYYDGGDRIYVAGGAVTITRASWIENRGVGNQGTAWEIYPVKPQLTTYILPFGENSGFNDFQRVYALVQATADNTTFTVDLNSDGTPEVLNQNRDADKTDPGDTATVTLAKKGDSFLLDRVSACRVGPDCLTAPGTLNAGTVIQGSETLQVKYVGGMMAQTYRARGFSAFPRGFWTKDYYAPLDDPTVRTTRVTDYYLYNPNAAQIRVDWESRTTSGFFNINAGAVVSYRAAAGVDVPGDSGLYFKGSDIFWGVGVGDANNSLYEWGFSLLPSTMLYSEHFLGWAPNANPAGATVGRTDMGVFLIAAQDNTRVFVDFNNDAVPDQTYTLDRLQTQYIVDPDGDLSQSHFWATGPFTLAYGQNADTAATPGPPGGMDLGYVAIPGTDFISLVLKVDKTADPVTVPTTGGTSTFTLAVDSEKYTIDDISVVDTMATGWSFVNNSATITLPNLTTITGAAANPTSSGGGLILTWPATLLGDMAENQRITITYTASAPALGTGSLSLNRVRANGSRTVGGVTQTFNATDFAYNVTGDVGITKVTGLADPAYPGDAIPYTVTVSNPGTVTLTGATLYDPIPAGTTYVAASGSVTCDSSDNVRDQFGTAAYTNNNGSVNWSGNWIETDRYDRGATGAGGGWVWVTGGQLQLRYQTANVRDQIDGNNYTGSNGTSTWDSAWAEANDDIGGLPTAGSIRAANNRIEFSRNNPNRSISRTTTITGITSVTISFVPTDGGIGAGETLVAEYSLDGGAYVNIGTYDGGTAGWSGATQTLTLTDLTATTITLRFRAPGAWNNNGDRAYVDTVDITFNNATGAAILRTANLLNASAASLSFTYAGANLEADDTLVAEVAASAGGPFFPLATFAGNTPSATPPYAIPQAYWSDTTTIRFRISGGYNATNETFSIDNVNVAFVLRNTFASGNPPNFLDSSTGCIIPPGSNLTLTFSVTVDDPFPTGTGTITNTASTTSVELPIAISASASNVVVVPGLLSAAAGGRVWLDADGDGVQDIGEPGIPSLEVTLKDRFGTPVAVAVTDSNGRYLFPAVVAGTGYYTEITDGLPAGLTQTFPSPTASNRSSVFNLVNGQVYTQADLGYRTAPGFATIGDRIWSDADSDGVQDAGEMGISGVTVSIYLDNGDGVFNPATDTLVASTTSGVDGRYLFTGLTATGTEDYFVSATTPSGFSAVGSTFHRVTDVNAGDAYLNADIPFHSSSSYTITDRVWLDDNGDGQDDGESGIAGVTLELLDASLNVIGTTTSGADGTFTFSGLPGGGADYSVRITDVAGVLIDLYGTTTYAQNRLRSTPNLAGNVNYTTEPTEPSFGFRVTRSIGDTVFNDQNSDGVQNVGELGIAGVVVRLYRDLNGNGVIDAGDTLLGSVTTNAAGQYLFSGLANGSYIVSVPTAPAAYGTFTGPGADSDGVTAGIQKGATIAGGVNVLTVDFGYRSTDPRAISGTVWKDLDADGTINGGETGIAGVTVDILSGATVIATLTTDASGNYQISGLAPGSYTVRVTDTAGVLSGYDPTYEVTELLVAPFNYQETVTLSTADVSGIRFGYRKPSPTYAAIAYLRAFVSGASVTVEWRTSLEVGTIGFHLLREDPFTGEFTRLNGDLLPGLLVHPQGGTYRFSDIGAPLSGSLTYKLVEVDLRGEEREYGPYTVVVSPAATGSRSAAATEASGGFLRSPTLVSPSLASGPLPMANQSGTIPIVPIFRVGNTLKITTGQAGLFRLPVDLIASRMGTSVDRATTFLKSGQFALKNRGRLIPYLPARDGSALLFYAEPAEGRYTTENVYWLSVSRGSTMATLKSSPAGTPVASFGERLHLEEDAYAMPAFFQDPGADFWSWDFLIAGEPGYDALDYTVRAPGATGNGPATLTVRFQGGTDLPPAIDHHLVVRWNSSAVGEARWDGITPKEIVLPIPGSSVIDGENLVEITAVRDDGVAFSVVYVDSVDLAYRRVLRAENDMLLFGAPGAATVSVGGFTSRQIVVLDVTAPGKPALVPFTLSGITGDGTYKATFNTPAGNGERRYLASALHLASPPVSVTVRARENLRNPSRQADYLLIAPAVLRQGADALAAYREGRGTSTLVVELEAVYDDFNYGIASPIAIRDFLRHAVTQWKSPPSFVTLVGRGTYDYRDLLGIGDNLVPPLLAGTPYGLVVSDTLLADLGGRPGVPDIAIGRLPVTTSRELSDYLAKIQAHETAASDPMRVLMAADNPDAGGNFPTDSDTVASQVPADHRVDRIYLPDYSATQGRKEILKAINEGVTIFNYIGHGGFDRLADENLLRAIDVPSMVNAGKLPLFVAMTCAVGNFGVPGFRPLGELMLLHPGGGSFATVAPTGLSRNSATTLLDEAIFQALFVSGERLAGNILLDSLTAYDETGAAPYVMHLYNLLGEPVSSLP